MVPKLNRGHSFKKLADYLRRDKREKGRPQPQTTARVGFVETLNFLGDAARNDPVRAARLMVLTWRSREALKRAAGIKPGGSRAEAPPVWHCSLSWMKGEIVSIAEMRRAALDYLAAQKLGQDKGHQTFIMQHTDTAHPHVHIVVNLVHPVTGKQANPYRDKARAQAWARAYEKQRGTIFCHERERTHASRDRARARHVSCEARAEFARAETGAGIDIPPRQSRRGDPDYQPKADRYGRERTKARKPRASRSGKVRDQFQQQAGERPASSEATMRPAMRTSFRQAADDGHIHDPARIIEALTEQQSTFTKTDLARHIWMHCADAEEFRVVMSTVEAAPEFVRLGRDDRGVDRFTARDLQEIERRMMADAVHLHGRADHKVSGWHRLQALQAVRQANGFTLSDEQKAAFLHVTGAEDLAAAIGFAGSGKSTMLGAARAAWQAAGYRVRGAALSGIAADGLNEGAGIDSGTIHSLLFALDKGRNSLTAADVLVVDEAGMIGSRLMARLLAHARAAGAKVVLVGDAEQLQAIDAGAAFRAIVERSGAARLTAIRRQREAWQQAATGELATAQTAAALGRYDQAGMLHGHATGDDAKAALIERWKAARAEHPAQSQIILAFRRADVRDLNELARAVRQEAGELGDDHELQTGQGARRFAAGDRIYFLKNDRRLGVRNGSLGTITAIEGDRLTVRADNGKTVTFSVSEYNQIDHGYAATVHKSQGVTVDRAHVLATRHMDRHAAYVAMTRHRTWLDVHWSRDEMADRAALARILGRSRAKDTTLDYDRRDYARSSAAGPAAAGVPPQSHDRPQARRARKRPSPRQSAAPRPPAP